MLIMRADYLASQTPVRRMPTASVQSSEAHTTVEDTLAVALQGARAARMRMRDAVDMGSSYQLDP